MNSTWYSSCFSGRTSRSRSAVPVFEEEEEDDSDEFDSPGAFDKKCNVLD